MRWRVATYNIHRCIGMDGIRDCRRIVEVLHEISADVVALQEVSSFHVEEGDIIEYLATATGTTPIEGFTMMEESARYGNVLLSKRPVSAVNRFDISIKGREPRGVIEAVLGHEADNARLWATHLGLGIRERHAQIEKLMTIVGAADAARSILLGDFNEWLPWGRPLRKLRSWFAHGSAPSTYPSCWPFLKLDRIWVRPFNDHTTFRAHLSQLSRVASDHLPLVADIVFHEE